MTIDTTIGLINITKMTEITPLILEDQVDLIMDDLTRKIVNMETATQHLKMLCGRSYKAGYEKGLKQPDEES